MGAQTLSSRAIIGSFYARLEQEVGGWAGAISMYFTSDQAMETYPWLGQAPKMREWVGGRQAKGLKENQVTAINVHYESTMLILVADLRRDKTGQILVRVGEQVTRANAHWSSLLSTLIAGGATAVCYDGQYFFDTDHSEGDSGAQSNKISVDISALPAVAHGVITAPSVEEMQQCILQAIQKILGFKDDVGEPMNELARQFLVMVPTTLWGMAVSAITNPIITSGQTNLLKNLENLQIQPAINTRLDASWTDTFAVFRTDGSVKPFIRQEEQGIKVDAVAEGSEFEFDNAAHKYGLDTWRTTQYGYWQHGCQVIMT